MTSQQTFDAGAVFSRAWVLFRREAFVLVSFAFVCGLGSWAFASIMRPVLGGIPTLVFETMIGSLIFAAQIVLGNDARLGRRRPLEEVWRHLQPRLLPVILLPMAAAGLTVLGFMLLIAPGFILAGLLLPLSAVIVMEDNGFSAIRRCIDLTRPKLWPMIGILFRLVVVFLIATVPVTLLLQQAVLGNGPSLLVQAGILVVNSALTAFSAMLSLMAYLALRERETPERVFE